MFPEEQLQGAKRTTVLKPRYSRRARGSRRSLNTVPPFVVVLLSTAGCAVVLGALVSLYAAYAGSAHANLGAHGIAIDVRANKFNMSSLEDTSCQSLFCHWNKNYIMGVVDDAKDPCDDFYAHVCNPQRWYRAGSSRVLRPFADFSAAQLIEDLERFFRYYVELRGKPVGDNFLTRMMWVYDACRRGTGPKRNASAELADIFKALGLSGAARPDGAIAGRIARVTAVGDRRLRLHPLFKVHVWAGGATKATASYNLVLSEPDTLYRRFIINYPGSTDSQYVDLVSRALTLYSGTTALSSVARKIMLLEKRVERMMLSSEEQLMMPPRGKYMSLEHLFLSDRWDWIAYFNTLFGNSSKGVVNDTEVFVNDPAYFRNLGSVMTAHWEPIIVNYMMFKAIVELAPVLGQETEYLVRLTHDYEVSYMGERQVACALLLEKLFMYGTGIAAKLTLGKQFATTPRFHMDEQLSSLFSRSRRLIADLVDAGRSWVSALDKAMALRKLRTMRFEFGAQCNLVEYELYRRAQDTDYGEHLSPSSSTKKSEMRDALNHWNGYSLPQVVFDLYSLAAKRYWAAWGSNTSRAYDNRYSVTAFRPDYEPQHTSNLVILPQATAAFLSHLSNTVDPLVYGVVAVYVVRGLLEALTRSGSSVDVDLLSHPWWSIATIDAYENISACLESQYQPFIAQGIRMRTLEMDFIDNAVLYPLLRLYRSEPTARDKSNVTYPFDNPEAGKQSEMDRLFFYNFAIALCDLSDEELWKRQKLFHITPAPWRVNVPLQNFPEFAKAFKCMPGSRMNPERRCSVWKNGEEINVGTDMDVRRRVVAWNERRGNNDATFSI